MQFPLELTENNVRKLMKGQPTQLKKEQLSKAGPHYVKVHPLTHKKLSDALKRGRGIRLSMTPQEFENSGEGFMDILRKIKKGVQFIKSNVIDSNLYQSDVKPLIRKLVDAGVTAAQPALGPVGPLLKVGVDKLGEVTNAYGLEAPEVKSKSKKRKNKNTTSGSFFIN